MTKKQKRELLKMLNRMSSGFDDYQVGKDECGDKFWGAWSAMMDYISNLPTVEGE